MRKGGEFSLAYAEGGYDKINFPKGSKINQIDCNNIIYVLTQYLEGPFSRFWFYFLLPHYFFYNRIHFEKKWWKTLLEKEIKRLLTSKVATTAKEQQLRWTWTTSNCSLVTHSPVRQYVKYAFVSKCERVSPNWVSMALVHCRRALARIATINLYEWMRFVSSRTFMLCTMHSAWHIKHYAIRFVWNGNGLPHTRAMHQLLSLSTL